MRGCRAGGTALDRQLAANGLAEAWTFGTARKQPTQLVASGGPGATSATWTWAYGSATWTYDAAGNQQTTGPGSYANTFDAENRLVTSAIGGVTTTYGYDGAGQRVQKVTGSTTTVYVYDAAGELAAEYDSAAVPPASACGTCYLTADALGSTRMITDETATPRECHDFLPFGEEITRSAGCYATTTSNTLKFTGKERDQETGLDYFGARYLSSAQERWTTVDPGLFLAKAVLDPQRWNAYGYGLNNPLRYFDPDGADSKEVQFGRVNLIGYAPTGTRFDPVQVLAAAAAMGNPQQPATVGSGRKNNDLKDGGPTMSNRYGAASRGGGCGLIGCSGQFQEVAFAIKLMIVFTYNDKHRASAARIYGAPDCPASAGNGESVLPLR